MIYGAGPTFSDVLNGSVNAAASIEGCLPYTDPLHIKCLLCKATVGRVERAGDQHRKENTPAQMWQAGIDTVQSDTCSTRGPIWGFSDPAQLLPRMMLQFEKIRQDDLLDLVVHLRGWSRLPRLRYADLVNEPTAGVLDESHPDFVVICDKTPLFRVTQLCRPSLYRSLGHYYIAIPPQLGHDCIGRP